MPRRYWLQDQLDSSNLLGGLWGELDRCGLGWSGRADLNRRPQRPERCALTRLRYAPIVIIIDVFNLFGNTC